MQKLLFFWSKLKSTFWFIPVLIIALSIVLALGLVYLDSLIEIRREGFARFLFIESTDSARSILTTISGAMIGVAGTVFSITLVALTLASSQFGPRLVKNFMYDHLNQVVLGSYISTYIYCLIILNTISDSTPIPSLSILLAMLAAIANIILLIIFIHHIAISIQADTVIANIAETMTKNLKKLFPETENGAADEKMTTDIEAIKSGYTIKQSIKNKKTGYLQYIDNEKIIHSASELKCLVELHIRPGDYLVANSEYGIIYSHKLIEKQDMAKLKDQFFAGNTRTHQQDPENTIHQMVEIAARALSPGVNDPYTAITCVDNLTTTMIYFTSVKFPSIYHFDEDNNLRLISNTYSFESMLDVAFNQIRQFSKGSPSVVIRLLEALIKINKSAEQESHKKAITKHAKMILNMAKASFDEPNDLEDLLERSTQILDEN